MLKDVGEECQAGERDLEGTMGVGGCWVNET